MSKYKLNITNAQVMYLDLFEKSAEKGSLLKCLIRSKSVATSCDPLQPMTKMIYRIFSQENNGNETENVNNANILFFSH